MGIVRMRTLTRPIEGDRHLDRVKDRHGSSPKLSPNRPSRQRIDVTQSSGKIWLCVFHAFYFPFWSASPSKPALRLVCGGISISAHLTERRKEVRAKGFLYLI